MTTNFLLFLIIIIKSCTITHTQSTASSSIQDILDLKTKINKVALNSNTLSQSQIDLYVASTNHLYKINDLIMLNDNSSLKIEIDLVTGPKPQKPQCEYMNEPSTSSFSTQCIKYLCDDETNHAQSIKLLKFKQLSNKQQNLIDNENRLLLIDSKNQHLIECGSVDDGGCRLRKLSDFEIIGCNISAPVIPFNSASGVIINLSSSVNSSSKIDDSSLYLMVSNEYDPNDRLIKGDFPAFSIRHLASTQTTQLNNKIDQSQLKRPLFQLKYPIESMNYDQRIINPDFHMKIVYSFRYDGYVYFFYTITNKILNKQWKRDTDSDSNSKLNQFTNSKIVTRLLRICDSKWTAMIQNQRTSRDSSSFNTQESFDTIANYIAGSDTNQATLTETVINCIDETTGQTSHILQSAYFHQDSKNKLNTNSMLFLNFNSSKSSSIICKVHLNDIDEHFESKMKSCLTGDNNYADLINPYTDGTSKWRCSMVMGNFPTASFDRKLFCQNDYFNYLSSRKPLTIKSINFDSIKQIKPITSIVSLNTNFDEKIAIIISTLDAQIYMFTYDILKNSAYKYDHINLLNPPSNLLNHQDLKTIPLSTQSSLNINLLVVENEFSLKRLLYVTYDRFLFKINLHNCEQFRTCDSCMNGFKQVSNPFCGWCVYKQECSLKQDCLNDLWLFNKNEKYDNKINQCPSITDIKPSKFFNPVADFVKNNKNSDEYEFKFNINLLTDKKYYCDLSTSYDKVSTRVNAVYLSEENSLKCNLTYIKSKFTESIRNKFLNLNIQIKTGKKSSLIASTNLYAFNCSYFRDCNECLNKELSGSCTWCAKNSKCVFSNQTNQCKNEVEFYKQNDRNNNLDVCTSFWTDSPNLNTTKIDIPFSADSNIAQSFGLIMKNLHQDYQKNFKCIFSKNKLTKSSSIRSQKLLSTNLIWLSEINPTNNQIQFDCVYSPYKDLDQINPNFAIQTVYMSIWWSNSDSSTIKTLDGWNQVKFKRLNKNNDTIEKFLINDSENEIGITNDDFIEINILNCEIKASSCGECMSKQLTDIGCGWCKNLNKCTMKKDCQNGNNLYNWLNDVNNPDNYCPNPTINNMSPRCGPKINAGTQLTLTGKNLGRNSHEVLVKMRPFGYDSNEELNCEIIDSFYKQSSKIVCKTPPILSYNPLKNDNEYSVYVLTNVQSKDKTFVSLNQSNQFVFKYVNPEILTIDPLKGIKSGGTVLKITGRHLTCGSDFSIKFMSSGSTCTILNFTKSQETDLDLVYCKTPLFESNQISGSVKTSIQFKMDDYIQIDQRFKFEYVDDPKILNIEPTQSILCGGLTMNIKGKDFDTIQTSSLVLSANQMSNHNNRVYSYDSVYEYAENEEFKTTCNIVNSTLIQCKLPEIKTNKINNQALDQPIDFSFYIQFNDLNRKYTSQESAEIQQIQIYPEPQFEEEQIFSDKLQMIFIKGKNLLRGVRENDYRVWIGTDVECNITSVTMTIIACILPEQSLIDKNKSDKLLFFKRKRSTNLNLYKSTKSYEIRVQIGENFMKTIGSIKYEKEIGINKYDVHIKYIIFAACSISFILLITMVLFFVILKRRQNKQIRQLKRMQTEFENLEMRVARECKEAFTELQMDIGELANTLNQTGAPFNDFQTYSMKILFPNANDTEKYYMTTMIDLRLSSANKENVKNGVLMFSQLILNKKFLLTFIRTLEADTQNFLLQDRVNLASYLSICLHDRLDYFTDILMTLLAELIEKVVESKNNPKILFRRNESIAEKMLANWFAFLLYDFIKDCAGTPLYILFLSIKQQIYKGPVDAITCEARYSLSEDKLIRQSIDYETITIRVQLHEFDDAIHEIIVKVLNCDTITQVKEKILDSFFKGYPYSKRPHVDDLDLIYISSEWNKSGRLILVDEDKTCKLDNDDFKRINTLAHYKVTNGALLVLASRQSYQLHSSVNDACNSYTMLDTAKNAENMTLLSKSSKGSSSPPTYSKLSTNGLNDFNNGGVYSAMNGSTLGLTESIFNNSTRINQNNNSHHQLIINKSSSSNNSTSNSGKYKKYHLIKSNDSIHSTTPCIKDDKNQEIAAKLVSEVYLTRLLATKGGMQSYVDDFFETVFSTAHGSNVLPYAIKFLFDFLDEQANIHGITDPDVVYTWKSNSLPLRFWVNIIKNPDFVFDIYKSNIVDASLSVIASTFMDSCSQSKLDLNKESPSGKLLFYKEVHKYRKWVESYYSEIKSMPKINDLEMSEMLAEESKKHNGTFNKNNSMYKLYNDYIKKYRVKIENSLNDEQLEPSIVSINKHLNYRLQQVIYLMDAIEV